MIQRIYCLLALSCCCIIFTNQSIAQNDRAFFRAEQLIEEGDFNAAIELYKSILDSDPDNAMLHFKLGFCYLNTEFNKDKAIGHLEKAILNTSKEARAEEFEEKQAPIDAYVFLARAYHMNYKFEQAISTLDTLKKIEPNYKTEFIDDIDKLVKSCEFGIELIKYPVKMFVTNLGSTINSEYDEHSPVFSADESTLIFTSKRQSTGGSIDSDGQYFEDIFIAYNQGNGQWSAPVAISTSINSLGHEASIGLSVDGQELFIYKDESGRVNGEDGNIFYSRLNGDQWSAPNRLGPEINTKYNENHASISADGMSLYFTSNRPGGYGGMDIYISKKLPTGNWGPAQNLGKNINTEYDEIGPFIHPDGITLFFSSQAHMNMGGFDIFFSSKDEDGNWEEPTNIGYPSNTTADDVLYMPTPDGRRAYYSSHKEGGSGRNDIYLISLPESNEKELTVMSGVITLADGTAPSGVVITVTDMETKEVIGTYTPNTKTGKYLFILKSGKTYNVLVETDNFLPFTETLEVKEGTSYQQIQRAIQLNPIILGNIKKDYNIKYEEKRTDLTPEQGDELFVLTRIMRVAKDYTIEIVLPEGNSELNTMRSEIILANLTDNDLDESRVKIVKTPSGGEKTIRINILGPEASGDVADNNANKIANPTASNNNNSGNDQQNNTDQNKSTSTDVIKIVPVFFAFDQATGDGYRDNLDKLANWMLANSQAEIEISGHADQQGTNEYNDALSKRRADFVFNYLREKRVPAERMKVVAEGENRPVAKDISPQSRKFNRRVEFRVIKQGTQPIVAEPVDVPQEYRINR